jgi:RIO kinase 1
MRNKEKSDRATVEQVLDPRTMMILYKLCNNERLSKIQGCIATGKEANVYFAEGNCDLLSSSFLKDPDGTPLRKYAIKIFKTSILVFKDRERYVSGEYRFRNGHCKSNPRKMVKLWGEKEVRNLKRICLGGIKAPMPYILKNNLIVMDFIGDEEGNAAPRLKDANIVDLQSTYEDVLYIMRRLYQQCRLVHADLSEYNLLYFNKEIYVIDVSQAIEHNHPMSLEFLRRDCVNINGYFKKKGATTLTSMSIFNFVTTIISDLRDP